LFNQNYYFSSFLLVYKGTNFVTTQKFLKILFKSPLNTLFLSKYTTNIFGPQESLDGYDVMISGHHLTHPFDQIQIKKNLLFNII